MPEARSTDRRLTGDHHVRLGHRPALDGLRALAVVAVVAFHSGLIDGGWLGVEVFFVLSGWLISSLLAVELDRFQRVDLGAFWIRRVRRLFPAIAVVLAVVGALAAVDLVVVHGDAVLGALSWTSNWVQLHGSQGYWDAVRRGPLEHLWSLAVEEQVYLLWPIVVVVVARLARRRHRAALVGVAVVVAAGGYVWAWWVSRHSGLERAYLGTDTRSAAFLVGSAAGIARWRPPRALAILAGSVVAVATLWMNGDVVSIFGGPLAGVGVAAAVFVAGVASWRRGPLTWGPLRAVGRWSYGIYLFHWPLQVAVDQRWPDLSRWAGFGVVLAGAVVLAAASYRFVEEPIRRQRRFVRRSLAVSMAALVGCLVGISAADDVLLATVPSSTIAVWQPGNSESSVPVAVPTSSTTDAAPTPVSSSGQPVRSKPTDPAANPTTDTVVTPPLTAPAGTDPPARLRVMVLGDSVAHSVATLLSDDPTLEIAWAGKENCGLIEQRLVELRWWPGAEWGREDCPTAATWKATAEAFRPDIVLALASLPEQSDQRYESGGKWFHAGDDRYATEHDLGWEELRLAIPAPTPLLLGSAPALVGPDFGKTNMARTARIDAWNRTMVRWAETDPARVTVIPWGEWTIYAEAVAGHALRPDGVHLELDAMRSIVSTSLLPLIRDAAANAASDAPG